MSAPELPRYDVAVGECALDRGQIAAFTMAAGMKVDDFARILLSFPTCVGIPGHAVVTGAHRLNRLAKPPSLQPGEIS